MWDVYLRKITCRDGVNENFCCYGNNNEGTISDYVASSKRRLTLTGTTRTQLFVDGLYIGERSNWERPFVIDISATSRVNRMIIVIRIAFR